MEIRERKMNEEIPITNQETEIAQGESLYIYGYLKKKFCNENTKDLDIVLNSLCFSLLRLMKANVSKEDRKYFIEIIIKILNKNIKDD